MKSILRRGAKIEMSIDFRDIILLIQIFNISQFKVLCIIKTSESVYRF
jgi:hypothetical protein